MKYKLLIIISFLSLCLTAQPKKYPQYPNPVKIPVYLSATFAELRSNAFHAGVDIKTQGVIGQEVYAVADGYISRIGVSPYGYGKVIYITHNDGFMSVYAHLDRFNKTIGNYVKNKQYENQSFRINVFLEPEKLPIKKGDLIGYSGNSGDSGGPHLHYELRDAKKQNPVNPMFFGLKINDNIKPAIKGLAVYPLDNATVNGRDTVMFFDIKGKDGVYSLNNKDIKVSGEVAFGISTFDKANDASNKNGAYSIELYADNELIFNIKSNSYSYNETRYINSLIDYAHWINCKERYVRTEKDPFNYLKLYEVDNGKVLVNEGDKVAMRYVVKDYNGNTSTLKFNLVGEKHPDLDPRQLPGRSHYRILNGMASTVGLDGFSAEIPEKAFYRDTYLIAKQIDTIHNIASDFAYLVGSDEIPVQNAIKLRIRPKQEYSNDTLLYIALKNRKSEYVSQGGKLVDGNVEVKTRNLGTFVLLVDTISPSVKLLNFNEKTQLGDKKSLKMKIKDSETGIKSYNIYLNDEWVLGEYDAKNDLLFYEVDEHLKKGNNNLKVIVMDNVGNQSIIESVIIR